jgi:xylulokinase
MPVAARSRPSARQAGQPLAVAVDVGTTGARAAAFSLDGRLVAEARRGYRTRFPRPGWAEQDPQDWSEGAVEALSRLARRLGRRAAAMRAIGLTGQCPTVAAFDARIRPVTPGMLYRDNRATTEAARMRDLVGEAEYHRLTGHVPTAFHVGAKMLWLRDHDTEAFRRTRYFLQPRDVVLHRLTGVLATDETHANATLFYDLCARAWDHELLARFGIGPRTLPPVLPPWQVAGDLSGPVAAEMSLEPGIPVVIGAADSQCAAYGAGLTGPGPVSEMAGASSCLNSVVAEPLGDLRVTHYSYVAPGWYCTELGVNTTGAAWDWAVNRLGYPGHDALAAEAERHYRRMARVAVPAVEAAPLFLPYLGDGERDDPSARAAFIGLSERHDRGALAFAVIEGVALAVATVLGAFGEAGAPVDELRVGGGAAGLTLGGRLKADLLGVPVRHLDLDPAGLGAAMLAAAAAGMAEEARSAIAATLGRARILRPAAAGREREQARLDWFRQFTAALRHPAKPAESTRR